MTTVRMFVVKEGCQWVVRMRRSGSGKGRPTEFPRKRFSKHQKFHLFPYTEDFEGDAHISMLEFFDSCEAKAKNEPYWIWDVSQQSQPPKQHHLVRVTNMYPKVTFDFPNSPKNKEVHVVYNIQVTEMVNGKPTIHHIDPELVITKSTAPFTEGPR